jgi:hypothetical protein
MDVHAAQRRSELATNFCDSRRPISIKREIARRSRRFFISSLFPLVLQYTLSLCAHSKSQSTRASAVDLFNLLQFRVCRQREQKKINENVPAGFQVSRAALAPSDRPCETLSPTPQGRCPLDTRTRRRRPNSPPIFLARNHLRTHERYSN